VHVSKSCRALLAALVVVGCSSEVEGTSDWMLGTFSDTNVNDSTAGLASLTRYEFREDGTLALTGVTHCAENRLGTPREYRWRRDGDEQVIVEIPESENAVFQSWVITRGGECNTLQVDQIQDGEPKGGPRLWRGAVCMQDLPPCDGVECPSCETVWCDEPPPACSE